MRVGGRFFFLSGRSGGREKGEGIMLWNLSGRSSVGMRLKL